MTDDSLRDAIRRHYVDHSAGGNLHVALDDRNLDDRTLRWIDDVWRREANLTDLEDAILRALMGRDEDQRLAVVNDALLG